MTYTLIKLAFKVSDMANKASSDNALSFCKSACFKYEADTVKAFIIVDDSLPIGAIKSQLPLIEFAENEADKIYIENAQYECDVLNGIIIPEKIKDTELPNGLA